MSGRSSVSPTLQGYSCAVYVVQSAGNAKLHKLQSDTKGWERKVGFSAFPSDPSDCDSKFKVRAPAITASVAVFCVVSDTEVKPGLRIL